VVAARIRLGGRQRVRSAMRRGAPLVSDDVFRFGGGGKGKGRWRNGTEGEEEKEEDGDKSHRTNTHTQFLARQERICHFIKNKSNQI
jgi:hypothetical protein